MRLFAAMRGGELAARDGDRRQEHDGDNVGEKAVNETDIDLVGQLVSWRGMRSLRRASAMQRKPNLDKPDASIGLGALKSPLTQT